MNRSRRFPQEVPAGMPILSAGRHRSPRQGACFMEFASYLAGERWSDHPACTHPVLAALARDVNDLATPDTRTRLTPWIHRVVGLGGDDLRVAAAIAIRAASAALPIASQERQRALAAGMLTVLDAVDDSILSGLADDAFATAPDSERWARRYLAETAFPREFSLQSALAIVHTAAVGISLACVDDADARLGRLLESAIEDAEGIMRPAADQPVLARTEFAEPVFA